MFSTNSEIYRTKKTASKSVEWLSRYERGQTHTHTDGHHGASLSPLSAKIIAQRAFANARLSSLETNNTPSNPASDVLRRTSKQLEQLDHFSGRLSHLKNAGVIYVARLL